jgi:flagellar hook protein FlgE
MSLIGIMGSGVSAMETFEKGLEVIGNNIANVNTTGFKAGTVSYADSFSNVLQSSSPAPSSGSGSDQDTIEIGTGVGIQSTSTNFGQGSLSQTGVPTDLGISGNGFFVVKNPTDSTEMVTRAGNFSFDSNGYLVDAEGDQVQGLTGGSAGTPPSTVGPIKLGTPPTGTTLQSYAFDTSGNLVETYSDGSTATTNQILMQNFSDPQALTSVGNNNYVGMSAANPTTGSLTLSGTSNAPNTNGLGAIQSGTLELSNVDLTNEFANLITTQRSFEAGSRLITVSDTLLEDIVNLKTH